MGLPGRLVGQDHRRKPYVSPSPQTYYISSPSLHTTNPLIEKGVFLGTKYAALQMKSQTPHANGDRGWIINVASVLGLNGA